MTDHKNITIEMLDEKFPINDHSYVNLNALYLPVNIRCKRHDDEYYIMIDKYLIDGIKCKKCIKNNFFIKRAKKCYGDRYDYSKSEYTGKRNKIEIRCRIHELFTVTAGDHMYDKYGGCTTCGPIDYFERRRSAFIMKCLVLHDFKYDYRKVEYKSAHDYIKIICPIHDEFTQQSIKHSDGHGCPECGKITKSLNKRFTREKAISKFHEAHGERYIYDDNMGYIMMKKMINIKCRTHGYFKQVAEIHARGHGCRLCAIESHSSNYSQISIIWLDLLSKYKKLDIIHAENGQEEKIDYYDKNNKKQYYSIDGVDHMTLSLFEFQGDFYHGNPRLYPDPNYVNPISKKTMGELYQRTKNKMDYLRNKSGYFNIIEIWECDFKNLIRNGLDPDENPDLKKYLNELIIT